MAIKTVPSATPLVAREPVLIVFVVVTIAVNFALTLVREKSGQPEWLDVLHGGIYIGQCLIAIALTGLMGRSWLGAFGTALGVCTLCLGASMVPEWWQSSFGYSNWPELCVAPLLLLIAAVPCIALRQLGGLRLAIASDVAWSRSTMSIGDIFTAVAFTAAMLAFAGVGVLGSYGDRVDFWMRVGAMNLTGFAIGLLVVVPAACCVFVVESRRNMVLGLGGLLSLPTAICAVVLTFVSPETIDTDESIRALGWCALASVATAAYFLSLLLPLHIRGYRLLRVPIAAPDASPARYRHASRWIVGALVAVAVVVNFYVRPIEESRERQFQFRQWVSSLGATAEEVGEETWELKFGAGRVDDDDLKYLRNVPTVVRLVLSGTNITDAGLEYIGPLTSLETLELNDTAVTDRGLRHLRHLTNLQSLSLQNTGVSGSTFAEFASRSTIVSVDLHGATVTDEGCRAIGELKALRELNLGSTSFTDSGLRQLGGLTSLQMLDLADTGFDGSGFESFEEMPDLAVLILSGSRSGDGVSHLVSNAPRLYELRFDRTAVTDAVLIPLQSHATIAELDLSGTAITDDGVSTLGKLPNLQKLWLDCTTVTGSGLRNLQARSLDELHLESCPVTDESLAHLRRFPRLRHIDLSDTPIGDDALSHFAGRWFGDVRIARTQITAQGLLRAHFEAGQLTIDDQQTNRTERAALNEMHSSVIVVPKSKEAESE